MYTHLTAVIGNDFGHEKSGSVGVLFARWKSSFEIWPSQIALKRKLNTFSLSIQIHLVGLSIFANTFRTLSVLLFFSCCTSLFLWQQFQGNHIKYFHFKSTIPQFSSSYAQDSIPCRSYIRVTKPLISKCSYSLFQFPPAQHNIEDP